MPITLNTAPHGPRAWQDPRASTAAELFARSCPENHQKSQNIIQSSFPRKFPYDTHISASQHGFIWALVAAYSCHHNLTIRPEDIWFSILTQLSFYVNAHAEELRSIFVSHEGQKELIVTAVGTIRSVDFGALAVEMTDLIDKNLVDKEFRDWLLPDFTTTTRSDTIVAAVLMMGTLQKYFSYAMQLTCGIPSVTLLGGKEDWEKLVKRLDRLPMLGNEPARFAELLRSVLGFFVASFENPEAPEVLDFWSRCAHRESRGSGVDYLCGWVSVFCFWNEEGKLVSAGRIQRERSYSPPLPLLPTHPNSTASEPPHLEPMRSAFKEKSNPRAGEEEGVLKDALSRKVDMEDVPSGFASVPVNVNDNGTVYKTMMLAGLVGIQARSTRVTLERNGAAMHRRALDATAETVGNNVASPTAETGLDTVQPVAGWWMYEKTNGQRRASKFFSQWGNSAVMKWLCVFPKLQDPSIK
ncbi:DUF4419 domain-containing protein [Aspergillus stella-maris]|uniref:DUF4419 domain-containing protein n=1 Tax=Aspergillus stella-maris TaxID=1810926 RepID=UPI003CCDC29A